MTLALHYALRSDVGLLREGNEDSAYAGPHLLVIADGMGGHAAGEVASAVAVSAIAPLDHQNLHDSAQMLSALADAVAAASNTLRDMTLADPSTEGMGTTLTAMLWSGAQVAMCHIGDSRAYLLRDGDFFQITRDHTLVQSLVDEGRLSPAAAATHPQRSLVMRALQSSTDAEPDLGMREAMIGDRYLLCSDGLSDVVTEQTLHKTLLSYSDPEQAVLQLIDLAIRSGGPDNITCIVADVVDTVTGPVAPSETTMLAGAAAHGDGRPREHSDSPATRAHLLTAEAPKLTDTAELEPVPALDGRAGPGHRAASRPAPRRRADPDDDDLGGAGPGRRRWPIVSSILVLLIILVGGGGYVAWRITQSQYYVGTAAGQVVIFRGINENVAGLSLSSAYRHTGIPVSHVQSSVLSLPTAAGTLAEAQHTVLNIRHSYDCKIALAAVATWTAHKPPPPPVIARGHKPTPAQTKAINAAKNYPPKPAVPSFCPAQGVG
ncbi:MAG TPA: protein phosphatase 2C domain-containing protein [Streptosporangiaceae bacterium]|nr:protein phosphatase 2C domain-containing protein [Streptosporangiaceae bacterium]